VRHVLGMNESAGASPVTNFMNTSDVGDIAESRILHEAKSLGFGVLTPFGDNLPYDMVIDTGEDLIKVQVKSGRITKGGVRFNTSRISQRVSNEETPYSEDEVDGFAVYCDEIDSCYWVPIEEANTSNMKLRVEETNHDHPAINWAESYKFKESIQ
jgi:hypothetical protein